MDLIQMARELGAALQQDERCVAMNNANKANEEDSELNDLMGQMQIIQMNYQKEADKNDDADQNKLNAFNDRFTEIYNQIMAKPNMQDFQAARHEVDALMKYITGILTLCVRGEDPATCEPEPEHECGGQCSSCGGCE